MPARGQSKKKTPPRVFFFLLRPRRKAREGEAPLGDLSAGPEQKRKHHPGCVFFCSGPGERQGKEKPRWAQARGQSKKRHLLWPRAGAQQGFSFPCLSPGPEQKKSPWVVFFFARPRRKVAAPNGASPSLAFRRGRSKKKTPWVVFLFFCSGPVPARGFSFPCFSPGPEQKKTPWVVLFFCSGPAERSRRPTERNKKKILCTPGADSKNISRSQRRGARAKRAHNKKTTPWPLNLRPSGL